MLIVTFIASNGTRVTIRCHINVEKWKFLWRADVWRVCRPLSAIGLRVREHGHYAFDSLKWHNFLSVHRVVESSTQSEIRFIVDFNNSCVSFACRGFALLLTTVKLQISIKFLGLFRSRCRWCHGVNLQTFANLQPSQIPQLPTYRIRAVA